MKVNLKNLNEFKPNLEDAICIFTQKKKSWTQAQSVGVLKGRIMIFFFFLINVVIILIWIHLIP